MTAEQLRRLGDLLARPQVSALLGSLDADGEEARIVGGAVRNALLGEKSADIDLATTALPQEVMRRAERQGWKAVPTGIAFGTVTVVIAGEAFEVTTLRADVETDGRRAVVAFTRDFAVDAARRDFTINALSLDSDGKVHGPDGAMEDIAARRIRFIGHPEQRISEDYLRILRFYRFSARYSPEIDGDGRAACRSLASGMSILSAERIGAELMKMLHPDAQQTLAALQAATEDGVLGVCLGGPADVPAVAELARTEKLYGVPRDALRWLAALAVETAADVERITARLRLSRAAADRLLAVISAEDPAESQRSIDPAIYRLGGVAVTDLALLHMASGRWKGTSRRLWTEAAVRRVESWVPPAFPLRAKDFAARGLQPGPEMGAALKRAEQLWLDQCLPMQPARLEAIADAAART